MKKEIYSYFKQCSEHMLKLWKGWPQKDKIPQLPRIIRGTCEVCKGKEELHAEEILWLNYHGEFNSGLPDYWLLIINKVKNKWGMPYYYESICPRCEGRSIVSQMHYPNGTSEICHNCDKCGVIKIKDRC
jgi:hypothetical protein